MNNILNEKQKKQVFRKQKLVTIVRAIGKDKLLQLQIIDSVISQYKKAFEEINFMYYQGIKDIEDLFDKNSRKQNFELIKSNIREKVSNVKAPLIKRYNEKLVEYETFKNQLGQENIKKLDTAQQSVNFYKYLKMIGFESVENKKLVQAFSQAKNEVQSIITNGKTDNMLTYDINM